MMERLALLVALVALALGILNAVKPLWFALWIEKRKHRNDEDGAKP